MEAESEGTQQQAASGESVGTICSVSGSGWSSADIREALRYGQAGGQGVRRRAARRTVRTEATLHSATHNADAMFLKKKQP